MSLENAETVEIDGRWYNIDGPTRRPFPPLFPFERESYATMEEAVSAARRRSDLGGAQPQTASEETNPLANAARWGPASAIGSVMVPGGSPLRISLRDLLLPLGQRSGVIDMVRSGSGQFIDAAEMETRRDRVEGRPVIGTPPHLRFLPGVLSDAEPVQRQLERDDSLATSWPPYVPRPGEPTTERERGLMDLLDDFSERLRRGDLMFPGAPS